MQDFSGVLQVRLSSNERFVVLPKHGLNTRVERLIAEVIEFDYYIGEMAVKLNIDLKNNGESML